MTPSDVSESSSFMPTSMVETGGVALRTTLPNNSPRLFFLESAGVGGSNTHVVVTIRNRNQTIVVNDLG